MRDGSYRAERKYNGRRIVIDLAEVHPPLGKGYEVMAMYKSSGNEIKSFSTNSWEDVVQSYYQMLEEFPEEPAVKPRKKGSGDDTENPNHERTPGRA